MKTFRLSDLRELMRAEAVHIEATQEALVYCGLRSAPDPQEIAKAQKMEALCGLCERASDRVIVERLRQLARTAAPARMTATPYDDEDAS